MAALQTRERLLWVRLLLDADSCRKCPGRTATGPRMAFIASIFRARYARDRHKQWAECGLHHRRCGQSAYFTCRVLR
jgi:hypothetical protein